MWHLPAPVMNRVTGEVVDPLADPEAAAKAAKDSAAYRQRHTYRGVN